MSQSYRYALDVLLASGIGLVAVLSNRLTDRLKVPTPLLVFVGAALTVHLFGRVHAPPEIVVEDIVTAALILILFDGGMHIGWRRFRSAAAPIASIGVLGTFLTAAGGAVVLHVGFGLDWFPALLTATAVAPTDPAVVFSVLGQREITGRAGTILEGESGANDPVGISLMTSLLAAGAISASAFAKVGGEFILQMAVGIAVGAVLGRGLLIFLRTVPLPSEALYPLRTLACAGIIYGVGTLAHGSGYLAVFVAGIVISDGRAPYKREIERFHSAMAGLAEIVAFVVLGLTVDTSVLTRANVLVPGLVLGGALAVVVRPLLVGACLWPAHLRNNERAFILFAGLKGAVPILLGELLRTAHVPEAERLFGIVVIVVIFSVLVQGSLVPTIANLVRLPMRTVETEPWTLGVRLQHEPEDVHRLTVKAGSAAADRTIEQIADAAGDIWMSIVVRDGELLPVRSDTTLIGGDQVIVLAEPELLDTLTALFTRPAENESLD
jgi:cell volume regulation protein A